MSFPYSDVGHVEAWKNLGCDVGPIWMLEWGKGILSALVTID